MTGDERGSGPLCLVTGATGYIGGRLVPELLAAGLPGALPGPLPGQAARPPVGRARSRWCAATSPTPSPSRAALQDVDVAYYLVHALGTGAGLRGDRPRGRRGSSASRPAPPASAASSTWAGSPRAACRSGSCRRICARAPRSAEILLDSRGAHDRAARRGHHRLRLGLLRDAALPHRAAARDGHPELGAHPDPARSPSGTCCATSSAAPACRTRSAAPSTSAARTCSRTAR